MSARTTKTRFSRGLIFKSVTTLLLVFTMMPAFRSGYTLPTLAVVELGFAFVCFPRFYKIFFRVLFPIIGYSAMCFFIAIPFDFKMGFLHPFMSLWIWIFPIILSSELIKHKDFDTNRFIYIVSLVILMIIIVATIKMMRENPVVMRDMTAGLEPEFVAAMNKMNVGGFGIAYGCGGILVSLTGCLMSYKMYRRNKYMALALIVVLGTLVVMAQFTTLLIICCAIMCYQVLCFKGSTVLKFSIILGIIILGMFSKDILGLIIDYFRGTVTAYHLQEIYDSVFGTVEYENTRRLFMANSFELFLKSPIWGNNVTSGTNAAVIYESHSTIMSILCKTGIIGLTAYLGAFWKALRPIYKSWDSNTKRIAGNGLIGYYLLLAFLNPAENDIFSYCMGLVAILSIYYFSNTQIKKYG